MATPEQEKKQVSEVQSGRNPQASLGGADSVDKTTYGSPGTPERRGSTRGETAKVKSGGVGMVGWIVGGLVVLALLVYGAGVFR